MSDETGLAVRTENVLSKAGQFTLDDVRTLRETLCATLDDSQFKVYMQVIGRTGLDPFAKQIYAITRYDKQSQTNKMTIQTGIDGYRLIAQRSREYGGQVGPFWCGPDGVWKDIWISPNNPFAAKIGVLRKGFAEPVWGVANWGEFSTAIGPMWGKMPTTMLAKCAEAQALRKAFPAELSGTYTNDEMEQAGQPTHIDMPQLPKPMTVAERIASAQKPAPIEQDAVPQQEPAKQTATVRPDETPAAWMERVNGIAMDKQWPTTHLAATLARWTKKHEVSSYLASTPEQRAQFEAAMSLPVMQPKPASPVIDEPKGKE